MQSYAGLLMAMQGYTWLCKAKLGYFVYERLCRALWCYAGYVGLCWAMQGYTGLRGAKQYVFLTILTTKDSLSHCLNGYSIRANLNINNKKNPKFKIKIKDEFFNLR
jgi:hypothetical protein